ncbi:GPI transamidase component gaa1 [Hypsizygus marmoreus]|uniref:GPI transamidase component gaa1 n=1 Tax=Hypsizygus marmoreus TaxID=39966 RepID=A0A369JLN8_HYPMA|nr:GPI transamidase component gaa1 [Hypsizygus marmoreus]
MEREVARPVPPWARILNKVRQRLRPKNATETRIRRRQAMIGLLTRRLPWLRLALFCVGYIWMIIIPSPQLGRGTYIDENALQPGQWALNCGQVNTYWSWGDVHTADKYLAQLEVLRDTNATSDQRAQFVMKEFHRLGISASTQSYMFSARSGRREGTNAYGILSSPRTSGTEAMVISASWLSRTGEGDGTLNLRGVSTVLALAGFLKGYSLWAKDIVFVISDGYMDGMHAWLAAYHGSSQSNLEADRLELSSGVIWTALNIDYPGHSFSHLGIFFEGLNGRLPNQDLLNSFQRISRYTGGVPVILYDHLDPRENPGHSDLPSWLPPSIRGQREVQTYAYQAKNVARHFMYQARGQSSGVHGLFHRYRIDTFTLFALPATGPHGFHAIGRIVESTLRTTNNLLERLHASFFFYIMTGPDRFLKIGSYLPSAILVSVAMMFGGLRVWVDAGWKVQSGSEKPLAGSSTNTTPLKWSKRQRPVLDVLCIMAFTHILGALLFSLISTSWYIEHQTMASPLLFMLLAILPSIALVFPPNADPHASGSRSSVLKALNLCIASTVISIISVLNFSLAALLAMLLGVPLSISSAKGPIHIRGLKYAGYTLLGLGWLLFAKEQARQAIWNWQILSVWFAPFACIVYVPLVLQAGLVCLLPPDS